MSFLFATFRGVKTWYYASMYNRLSVPTVFGVHQMSDISFGGRNEG